MPRLESDVRIITGGISSATLAQKPGELRKRSSKVPTEHP